MAQGNILKEAIADAKAVREVALANAKAALEEAFTPKLQSMLSAKLSEDLEEDDFYEEEDERELDLGEMEMDMEEEGDLYMDGKKDKILDPKDLIKPSPTFPTPDDPNMEEEIDLEEILNELELEEGDEAEEEDEIEEAVGYPNYKANQHQKVKHDADDINQGLNETFDLDSLLKEINDLEDEILEVEDDEKDLNERGMAHHSGCDKPCSVAGTNSCPPGHQCVPGRGNPLQGCCQPVGAMSVNPKSRARKKPIWNKRQNMPIPENKGCGCNVEKGQIKNLQAQLKESKQAYTKVHGELNEVNLLNSKLLYVNRIFKANTLSESQKLRVVETLDKATSVKEAKLIYETVKNTFTISSPKKNKTNSKRNIKENFRGMASKATGMSRTRKVAPKKAVLKESNDMVARMQKLANISKIK